MGFRTGMQILCLAIAVAGLTACARDDEAGLHDRLSTWFFIDETRFFRSKARCTAAMFSLSSIDPRPGLTVQSTPNRAKAAFDRGEVSALRMAGYSPNDLTDALLLTGRGTMGKEALAAGAQAVPCFKGTEAQGMLRDALTTAGATMAFDQGTDGLIILDPVHARLFYVAGDVW